MQSSFPVRGVIEGFYGPFYTVPERNDLIRFMGQYGYNLYIYGPKNDRQHRNRWREAYPDGVLAQFAETVALARAAGVEFCYALSPLNYDPRCDFPVLTTKLHRLYACGVRAFSLFLDDLCCVLHGQPECSECAWSAQIDIDLCNGVLRWLQSLDPACTLSMCPTFYHGRAPFNNYLHELGAGIDPEIDIFYTGPQVCSPTITTADAHDFAAAINRPPLLWDNYPVNDLAMRHELHLGPINGRDTTLASAVRGVVINPMVQAEASKIALATYAAYFADPHNYDPWNAWEQALIAVGGSAHFQALRYVAATLIESCVPLPQAPPLERAMHALIAAMEGGDRVVDSTAWHDLHEELNGIDEGSYVINHRMENLRLRHELLPWIEALEKWIWVGKRSQLVLAALETHQPTDQLVRSLEQSVDVAKMFSQRTSGRALEPLAQAVLGRAALRSQHGRELATHRELQPALRSNSPVLASSGG